MINLTLMHLAYRVIEQAGNIGMLLTSLLMLARLV